MRPSDQALEILKLTKDGNALAPPHLAMVQAAVTDRLTEQGEVAFTELYEAVRRGKYDRLEHWLCGVPHLTRDHEGYVYWKGVHVEHYSHQNYDDMRRDALHLAQSCQTLETKGFPVNARTAIDAELLKAPADTPWLEAMCRYYSFFVKEDSVRIIFYRYAKKHEVVALEKRNGVVEGDLFGEAYDAYHGTVAQGYASVGGGLAYERIVELLERSGLTPAEIHAALV